MGPPSSVLKLVQHHIPFIKPPWGMAPRMIPFGMFAEPVQGKSTPQNDAERRMEQIAFPFEQKSGFSQENSTLLPDFFPGKRGHFPGKIGSRFTNCCKTHDRPVWARQQSTHPNSKQKTDFVASLLDGTTRN